jgi:hypothetical protein
LVLKKEEYGHNIYFLKIGKERIKKSRSWLLVGKAKGI